MGLVQVLYDMKPDTSSRGGLIAQNLKCSLKEKCTKILQSLSIQKSNREDWVKIQVFTLDSFDRYYVYCVYCVSIKIMFWKMLENS